MPNTIVSRYREALRAQGVEDPRSDDELTIALGQRAQTQRPDLLEANPDFREDFYAIREANSPGTLGGIANTAKNAFDRSRQALNVAGSIDDTDSEDIAAAERRIQGRPASVPWEDWQKVDGVDAIKVFLRDPIEITSNIVASGFAGSLPAIGGGLAGGVAGAAAGGPAAPVTGPIGAAIGTGAGSLAVEYGNKYLDVLRDAGADLSNGESIRRVVADPALQEKARDLALRRGIPVATFDAISAGLAGKFLKGVHAATTAQNIRHGLTEAAIQGALGGAGEIAGALSAGEQVSPRAVFEEVVGELGPGAAEVSGAAIRRRMAERVMPGQQEASAAPGVAPVAPVAGPAPAVAPIAPTVSQPTAQTPVASPARRVALMTDEQKTARFAELSALTNLTADEQQELELLRALVGAPERPENVTTLGAPEEPVSVGEMPATGVSIGADENLAPAPTPESPVDFSEPASVGTLSEPPTTGANAPMGLEQPGAAALTPAPADPAATALAPLLTPSAPVPALPAASQPVPTVTGTGAVAIPEPVLPGGEPAPAVPELTQVPAAPQPSATLEDRLRAELKKPEPFTFGTINEGSGLTVDLRDDARFENLTPEMAKRLPVENALDEAGNRAKTRVAVVLEAPNGRYIKAGLLVPQEMGRVGGAGEKDSGPAVQSMAAEKRAGGYQKVIKEGGNRPALLADVIAAGYKLRAIVHFDAAPGSIFQRFSNREAFDASYGATERTNASSAAAKMIPTASPTEGIERRNAMMRRDAIQRQIDGLGAELESADPARAAEINDEIRQLYADLARLPEPRLATESAPSGWESVAGSDQPTVPAEADRANQFALVAARLRQAGAKVDVFAKTFLQASLAEEFRRRLDHAIDLYHSTPEAQQPALQKQIELGQQTLASLERVRGVAYSANHIALGLEDVQAANLADFVTLLHEAGHMLLKGDPAMQARVLRAVDAARTELAAENAARTERIGFNTSRLENPEELLVQTLAQRLAEEGVPDSPSLARAAVQWVKDLYYRLAMAVQSAFGVEPSAELSVAWFENQLRRLVGGDYDYRFGDIFTRWMTPAPAEQAQAIGAKESTPAGLSDFYDPLTQKIRQPDADPSTRDAVNWNLRFAEEATPAEMKAIGADKDIPFKEAKARIMAAAINEEGATADKMFAELQKPEGMTFEAFWSIAGRGDMPKLRIAEIEQQVPGASTAAIGGEKMTEPMNQQARVQAKRLIQKWQWKNIRRIASDTERSARAEAGLVEQAKLVNKIEGDLRNAEMHEATLRDKMKEMIRTLAKGMRRGLDTAFAAGELAEAVREAEDLSEREAIPEQYQKVFQAIMADEVPVFEYLNAIAKLDMPLGEMTRPEIIAGIRDNAAGDATLARLVEPRNKPLLVALTALSKKNAEQMDLIQLRAVKDPAKYLAIKADLDAIRNANEAQLKAIAQAQREGKKAITFADRIKRNYVDKRAKLRKMQSTIQEAESRRELLERVNVVLGEKVTDIENNGLTAPSEWIPVDGATWTAMQQDADGMWKASERTLRFTPEGPAVDADQVRADLAQNRQWLMANEAKAGTKLYETVKRQTMELQALDLQQRYPEGWRHMLDKLLQPLGQAFSAAGGAGARVQQMLNNFQFIQKSYWHGDLENLALQWTSSLRKVGQSTGIKDHGAFFSQIYDPVLYYIQTEPGLEEGPALREAVRAARRRLPTPPGENFDETFKDFMRRTKAISERYVAIAEQHGAFVKDPRLGGDLRRAVAQGWLTVMRRVNSSVVSALTREMQGAGWSLKMEDDGKGGQKIVRASTFDALMPDGGPQDEAKIAVLEDPAALAKAIDPLFTPNIVRTWLEPFLNKPGEPLFRYQGDPIDQMEVQQAWQSTGGNVMAFIDVLGQKVGLTLPEENEDGEPIESQLSPEAEFRASMLRQIDRLFAMESRIAADAAQTKNLFDPMGPKPHVVMDARLNELIPPEHLEHVTFDPISSRNLLATLAFHGAFGRNGERMTRTLDELKSSLTLRKNEFDSLTATTEAARKAEATARGIDYAAAKRGSRTYRDVLGLQESLKGMFAFNQQAGVLGDMRTGLEVLHFITGQTVNNPKTAFLNMLQPAQRALVRRSLGVEQMAATGVAYAQMAKQVLGSILENFGLHVLRASEHARDIGAIEGQGYGQLPWSVIMSDIGKRGRFQDSAVDTWAIRPLRAIAAAQRKGVRVGFGESKDFPRLNVVPGAGGIMNYMSQVAATSNGVAEVWALERMVKAGMDYLAAHPDKASDASFRFSAADLGMKNRWWFDDEPSFDYYRRKTVEYGVGNLEDIVRGAMERTAKGEQLLTREQALRTAMMAGNELDLQASINTRPAGWATSPILKFGLPLLGWPLSQMNQVHQALKTVDGRFAWLSMFKGLGIMAAWSLPMGLAFTFMTDEYDDRVLKKKSNLRSVDKEAAIPLVGPALALATGERGLENIKGMFERMSKAGNIYGVGADFASQTLNSIDPTSGQRPFSLDQRVLVFSQFMNLWQGLSNWMNQGGTATWASVERPIVMAMGGNGALQAVDIFNGLLGLDNQESRLVQRTNAAQWLRSAGRETGLELRRAGAGSVAPTPVSVWMREMQFAAYANDRLGFLDAYRRAVDAAREEGKPNPEQTVLDGWKARDPLDVFRVKPTDIELAKALSVMSENGQEAVRDAIRLFDQYTALIAPSQAELYQKRMLSQIRQDNAIPNVDALRRRMAGANLSVSLR
jgi:hypothetical protein